VPEICYKRNFLSDVIARFDFASPIQKISAELPSKISEKALRAFPIQEPKQAIARELQITGQDVQTKNSKFTEWNFYGKEREKRLVIFDRAILVTYKKFSTYESFKNDFIEILNVMLTEIPEIVPNRLGIRYINKFDLPGADPFDLSKLFNQHLLALLEFHAEKKVVSRAFGNLEFNFQDFNLRFQFGMPNPDYPATIKKRHFILDFDAYFRGFQIPQEVPTNLDRYHAQIQALFEASITDKMREILNA